MPEIKHYDGKKKHAPKPHAKRRPHREVETIEVEAEEIVVSAADITDMKEEQPQAQSQTEPHAEEVTAEHEKVTEANPEKIHLEFYGSDVIREKAPKVMELAETVAEEWVHDGQFEGLPLGNPLAQVVAAKALRKAKDVEKKLEEKGVFMIARMGVDYVKSEINKRKK